jgi:hypothetical protein
MNVTTGHAYPPDRPVVARGDPMNPLETLVQARLDDIHADVSAAHSRRAVRRGASESRAMIRARIRIGRGLVAFGAAVAGEERHAQERHTA